MTYLLDFRKQVLKSLDEGMTFAEAAKFYNLSPTTIQNWKRRVHSKTTRQTKPYKYQMTCYSMMSKNILMIISTSEHVV